MTRSKFENLFDQWSHLDASERDDFMDRLSLSDREQLQERIVSKTRANTELNTSLPNRENSPAEHFPTTVSPDDIGEVYLEKGISELPDRIGDYRILNVIAIHGQGIVYRADHLRLNRQVVVKVVRDKLNEHACQSLIQEGRSLAALSHPNIAQIFDLTIHEGNPCLVMEYIDGRNLSELYAGTPVPAEEAASLVRSIAMGMEHAHRNGVVHRDLKPANVVLRSTDKLPKIIDFGLARARNAFALQAENSSYGGTVAFMAPEQAEWMSRCSGGNLQMDDPTDERTDIFAMGAILYSLLTGSKLYDAESLAATLEKAMNCGFDPVELDRSRVPKWLRETCLKALSQKPSERFRTASEFAAALVAPKRIPSWVFAVPLFLALLGSFTFFMPGIWQQGEGRDSGSIVPDSQIETEYPKIELTHHYYPTNTEKGRHLPLFASRDVVEDDEARIAVDFHNPVYSFIFAINTDGVVQLCYPEEDANTIQLEPIKKINFPSNPVKVFPFTDGPGQQIFLIVWSPRPLHAFNQWLSSLGDLSQIPDRTKGKWIWKDGGIETWGQSALQNPTTRGDLRDFKSLPDIERFISLCKKIEALDCQVYGVTFPVAPLQSNR